MATYNGGMLRRSGLALLSALLLAACGAPPQSTLGLAPAFELRDLSGGTLNLAALKGKVVVLDFWAIWCGPCLQEIPSYADFWRKNAPRGVEVIGVVFDSGEPKEIQDFVQERRIPYRQLLGDEKTQDAYGANQGFPTTFVIDTGGNIKQRILGANPRKFEMLQSAVDEALSGRS